VISGICGNVNVICALYGL